MSETCRPQNWEDIRQAVEFDEATHATFVAIPSDEILIGDTVAFVGNGTVRPLHELRCDPEAQDRYSSSDWVGDVTAISSVDFFRVVTVRLDLSERDQAMPGWRNAKGGE